MSTNRSFISEERSDALEIKNAQIISTRVALEDCLFLALVVVLSFILYVRGLGLYSDDWWIVGLFRNASDQSLFGLVQAFFPETAARPIQSLYLAGLYWLFGIYPLGYHLVNGVVFSVAILLFYLALRELALPRMLTLSVPLVYALLPHYSTDRLWFATFQANLSMGLYFLSLYSDLRAVRAQPIPQWGWKLFSIFALLASVLAYEVVALLFLFNLLLVWHRVSQLHSPIPGKESLQKSLLLLQASSLLALALAVGYKMVITDRMVVSGDYLSHLARLVKGAIVVNYYSYGLGLPLKVGRILYYYLDVTILAVGGLIGLVVFGYLYHAISRPAIPFLSKSTWLKLIAIGLIVFGLGYGVFLTTSHVGFTTSGVHNRTSIAAALGVGMSFVGGIGWMSSLLPSARLRRAFFCLLVTLLCICGFIITNTIAVFWIAASRQQHEVITAIRHQFPTLPRETTLILDGVCPYIGPGIVFECYWDVAGMLRTHYHDPTLKGDIVKPNLEVKDEGLYTTIYGEKTHYPYNDKLLLYHFGHKKVYQMTSAGTARRYFQAFNPNHNSGCPPGREGYGVTIF